MKLWENDMKKFIEEEIVFVYKFRSRFFQVIANKNMVQSLFSTESDWEYLFYIEKEQKPTRSNTSLREIENCTTTTLVQIV